VRSRAKILDFGLAKVMPAASSSELTEDTEDHRLDLRSHLSENTRALFSSRAHARPSRDHALCREASPRRKDDTPVHDSAQLDRPRNLREHLLVTAAAQSGPIVTHDLYHDTSAPVRDYASSQEKGAVHPLERPRPLRRPLPGPVSQGPDVAEQAFALSRVSATLGFDFDGIPNAANGTLDWSSFR
jgi:hypothetical protein